MNLYKIVLIFWFLTSIVLQAFAQNPEIDSVSSALDNKLNGRPVVDYRLKTKRLILPAVFIGYGAVSLGINALKELNHSTQYEINEHQPDHIKLDNYSQYVPAALVYGLNAFGYRGAHDFKDRTLIYAGTQVLSAAFVLPLKHLIKEERPDGSNMLSFPSGHTATAFSTAQFMFREYKDQNIWIALAGFPFAIFTGTYRTLNDRHWVNDVVAGAGFGILSTELTYFLYPRVSGLFRHHEHQKLQSLLLPTYQNNGFGLTYLGRF